MLARHHALKLAQSVAWITATLAALHWAGAGLTTVVAGSAIAAAMLLAIGLSLQTLMLSIIAGLLIETFDWIEVGEQVALRMPPSFSDPIAGLVTAIEARTITLRTDEGCNVDVPNSLLLSAVVVRSPSTSQRRSPCKTSRSSA